MRKAILLMVPMILTTALALAQQGPPPGYPSGAPWPPVLPCGSQGVPDNVACVDHGKIVNTKSPSFTPHQDWTPEQKAIWNGTYPQPTPVKIPKFKPTPLPPIQKTEIHFPSSPTPQQGEEESEQHIIETPPAPSSNTDVYAEQQREYYESGQAIGAALGRMIYAARLRHAINKACFDQGAEGWKFEDGHTIACSDRKVTHPRHARGIPPDLTPMRASKINQFCSQHRHHRYTTTDGYSYSCKDWRTHETTAVNTGAEGEGIISPSAPDASSSDFSLVIMAGARKDIRLHPYNIEAKSDWVSAQETYCQQHPDATYTDLDGKKQSCKAGN
jgi:hypothetical protein